MLLKSLIMTTLCVVIGAMADVTPVFLWGVNSAVKPALKSILQSEFADLVSPLLKDHMVVAFQENGLSTEDFLCTNLETAQSCYAQLQGVSPKTYYPNVENAVEALHSITVEHEHNHIDKTGKLANPIDCVPGKVVFVSFDDAEPSSANRQDILEAHDAAIADVTQTLKCQVAYIYLGKGNTVASSRLRRDAGVPVSETAATKGGYIFRQGSQFLLFFTSVIINNNGAETEAKINSMTVTNSSTQNANQFSVSLATDDGKTIAFDIVYTNDGYYNLKNVVYADHKFRSLGVNAPTTFSYFCGTLTFPGISPVESPNPYTVIFDNIQFQAPFGSTNNGTFVFGDAWHCVGFFTPAILGGLFVVVLLLVILFTGICWMMDINTMDRFDDSKGKTITINASE